MKEYFIPNVLATWSWPRRLDQYYPEVNAETTACAASFQTFSPEVQKLFDRCHFGKT